MTNPTFEFSTGRKSRMRSYALVILAWMTCTVVLTSTPLVSDTKTVPSPTLQQQVGHAITKETLQGILQDSGVLSQLTNLSSMIIGESRKHWQNCESPDAQLENWLNEAFADDRIIQIAIDGLRDTLDIQAVNTILQWLDSPSGQAIIDAERLSASLSEDDFERYITELDTLPAYRTERAPRIRALISSTRAGNFVSVLNTELNSIISLSTACSPNPDTVRQLLEAASAERGDLSLVSLLMNINLHAPTAVIYRQLDNRVLDDYLEFSASPAGKVYHDALINVTRDTLLDRLELLASKFASSQ